MTMVWIFNGLDISQILGLGDRGLQLCSSVKCSSHPKTRFSDALAMLYM